MTKEEKKQIREAKKAARLEKKRIAAEKKRAKREAKKAKRIAKLQKQKERKRLAKEKAKAAKIKAKERAIAKKQKDKIRMKKIKAQIDKTFADKAKGSIDVKVAAKQMKSVLKQIAFEMSKLDVNDRDKKIKSLSNMGYDIRFADNEVVVQFVDNAAKKVKCQKNDVDKTEVLPEQPKENETEVVDSIDEPTSVEMVPAGDLLGSDGQINDAEVANIDEDDDSIDDDLDDDNEDDTFADSRDEQDEELIENRREYFGNFNDDGEASDF